MHTRFAGRLINVGRLRHSWLRVISRGVTRASCRMPRVARARTLRNRPSNLPRAQELPHCSERSPRVNVSLGELGSEWRRSALLLAEHEVCQALRTRCRDAGGLCVAVGYFLLCRVRCGMVQSYGERIGELCAGASVDGVFIIEGDTIDVALHANHDGSGTTGACPRRVGRGCVLSSALERTGPE